MRCGTRHLILGTNRLSKRVEGIHDRSPSVIDGDPILINGHNRCPLNHIPDPIDRFVNDGVWRSSAPHDPLKIERGWWRSR